MLVRIVQNEKNGRVIQKVLKKQVQYARKKHVDGFAFFDYQDLKSKTSAKAVNQLKNSFKNKTGNKILQRSLHRDM